MEFLNNLIEYYDELYPVSKSQKEFFEDLLTKYEMPARFLGIGCSSGFFEHFLALKGHDVTGIDTSSEMLESANRRRRMPNTAIRFFQMSTIEMSRFLGKNFYNVISCLNSKIIFIHDETLLRKFFFDCKSLLTEEGTLVLQLGNFSSFEQNHTFEIPTHESIRVSLISKIQETAEGKYLLSQELDRGDNHYIQVLKGTSVLPITPDMIENFAKEAGFKSINFYKGWTHAQFTGDSNNLVCVLQ
jgi:2-polyprenyl-3-methyl-5-hydroxy-6-metoxy-1,4-benzoquinol methylase